MSLRHFLRGVARCVDIFGLFGSQTVDEHLEDLDTMLAEIPPEGCSCDRCLTPTEPAPLTTP